MGLFELKNFIMHSGGEGKYKIECDALTDEDWETLAYIISEKVDFKFVMGVPTGAIKLEHALIKYRNPKSNVFLIVDDVFTTGKSMEEARKKLDNDLHKNEYVFKGVVVFARNPCPDWISPIFRMW